MKKFGFFVLITGIFLLVFLIGLIFSSGVTKTAYRKGEKIQPTYYFMDTTRTLLSDFRRTNYVIRSKPIYTYDEDGELEVEYEDYDRSYFGSNYTGGSYSRGK